MSITRARLRELLESEEGQRRLQAIWDDVTTKRVKRITSIDCPRCQGSRKVDVTAEVYDLKAVTALLSVLLSFGVGKPPEEKKIALEVRRDLPLSELTNEELDALEAEYEELEDQPALPPETS